MIGKAFRSGGAGVRIGWGADFWMLVLTTAAGRFADGGGAAAAVEAFSRAVVCAGSAREIVLEEACAPAGGRYAKTAATASDSGLTFAG
jgi:hypothetical protein